MKNLFLSTIFLVIAFASNAQIDNTKLQQDFVKELNAYRASKGLGTVKLDSIDISQAKKQATYCASIKTLTHDYPEFKGVYAECALFNTSSPDAKFFLNTWISSIPHNELLLLPEVTSIGIFYVKGINSNNIGYYAILVLQP